MYKNIENSYDSFKDARIKERAFSYELWLNLIDEADKMMDMGFMPQIRQILEKIPYKKRQNGLFSATFPEKVENLSHEFLEFPHKIEVTPQATPASQVTQYVFEA
jgi:ATP-dependent RNA helicase RhlE